MAIGTRIDPKSFAGPYPKAPGPNKRNARLAGVIFEVQGLGAVIEHWQTTAQLTLELTPGVLDFFADVITHNARQFVRKRTWATHDSINKDPGVYQVGRGNFVVDIGPTTFYSRFLEWGTLKMSAKPFMVPAIDMATPDYFRAMEDIARIPDQLAPAVGLSGKVGSDPRVTGPISSLRSGLYSASKFLGDIAIFGGASIIRPIRGGILSMARLLGDVSSVMNGTIGMRFSHRLRGRATGRLQGFGSASLTASRTYSGSISGGQRIYNRFVGRQTQGLVTFNLGGF